jgi:hypothetical protein
MIRKLLFSALLLLALWGVARLAHHKTDGLRLSKFSHNIPTTPLDFEQGGSEEMRPLLEQKFTYFGRGLQSFSFLGEDGTTVLKLFNNHYQKRIRLARWLPDFYPFKAWKRSLIRKSEFKLTRTFDSYLLAFDQMQKETGLLFLHPQPGEGLPTITLIDKLNIAHPFDLNSHAFALQKKAEPVYPYLLQLKERGELAKAQEAVKELVSLMRGKMSAGIGDNDPLIRTNLGFENGRPMQIDIGPFYHNEALKNPEEQKNELKKITLSMKHWLESHYPELLETLDEAI